MSSVLEKSESQEVQHIKKSFFFRSTSIEKLKCSAVYPFQIAGAKLSKGAIIELLQSNIIKARIATQKAQISFYIAALRLLSTLLTSVVGVSANCDNNTATATKAEPEASECSKTFHERLHEKLTKLQSHKHRVQNNYKDEVCPEKHEEAITALATFHESFPAAPTKSTQSNWQRMCFMLCVHLSLVFMYMQILILAIALNTTSIPFGMFFMFGTAGFIGYIIFKIFFIKNYNKDKPRKSSKLMDRSSFGKLPKDVSPERESRQKFRRIIPVIDFNSKTLSKVKLL